MPTEYWKISFINEQQEDHWTTAYHELLNAGYRWQVRSALTNLIHDEHPWERYPNMRCDECRDGVYLLDVSHIGIGSKTVQIMILFDKPNHTLVPLYCEIL